MDKYCFNQDGGTLPEDFYKMRHIKTLQLINMKIDIDLSFFPNLEKLSVISCDLERLDTFYCPKLKILRCTNNKIKNLRLSNNNDLEELSCAINEIRTLILPRTVKICYCSHNNIQNISINGPIQKLYCQNNRLTGLYSRYPIQDLNCDNNRISILSLDIVKELSCSNNFITRIEVKKCEILDCSDNLVDIKNLNLSKIRYLNCSQTETTKLKKIKKGAVIVANGSKLKEKYWAKCSKSETQVVL